MTYGLLPAWQAAAAVLLLLVLRAVIVRKRRGPMPPGPPGWPIIGNVLDIPLDYSWHTFAKWAERWGECRRCLTLAVVSLHTAFPRLACIGDLMSIVLLGQPMIIINSYKHAYELLERRSAIYSDRPHMIMAGDVVGWDQVLVLLRYGPQFREYRRLMARALGSRRSVESFAPVVEYQTGRLLLRLLRTPVTVVSDLPAQVRKYVTCSLPPL